MFIYLLFNFWKLWIFRCFPFPENSGTPMFPISGNSGLRCFLRFSYYVIPLVLCLHPSLVTPSAVGNTSLSLDLQFPFALPYCLAYVTQFPLLCTWYNSSPFLSYKYLYSVARSSELRLLLLSPILSFILSLLLEILKISLPLTYLSSLLVTCFQIRKFRSPEFPRSLTLGNPGSLRDSTGNRAIP